MGTSNDIDDIAKLTYYRLMRLPTRPLELIDACSQSDALYALSGQPQSSSSRPTRENLQVTTFHSTNTIRVAFLVEIFGSRKTLRSVFNFADAVAELLEAASLLACRTEPGLNRWKWFIVRAFLWTTWRRSMMLMFSHVLSQDIESGQRGGVCRDLALRRTFPSPRLSIQEMSRQTSRLGNQNKCVIGLLSFCEVIQSVSV